VISIQSFEDALSCAEIARDGEELLYATIELPWGNAEAREEKLALLRRAVATERAPAKIAELVARGLGGDPSWVFFAAVHVGPRAITACTAGPHRVHLLRRGALVASTREHLLRSDAAPPDWLPHIKPELDLRIHGRVVTRSLGSKASHPAEVTTWSAERPFRVVVASTEYHRDRDPEAYLTSLGPGEGALAVLDAVG